MMVQAYDFFLSKTLFSVPSQWLVMKTLQLHQLEKNLQTITNHDLWDPVL